MPLRTELKNGDVVEVITADDAKPNPAWLAFVRTGRARSKIRVGPFFETPSCHLSSICTNPKPNGASSRAANSDSSTMCCSSDAPPFGLLYHVQ